MVRAKDWPVKRITKANVNYYNRIYLFSQIEITLQQKFGVHVLTKPFHCQKLTKIVREKKSCIKFQCGFYLVGILCTPKLAFFTIAQHRLWKHRGSSKNAKEIPLTFLRKGPAELGALDFSCDICLPKYLQLHERNTTAKILSGNNARAWVSMVLYLKR